MVTRPIQARLAMAMAVAMAMAMVSCLVAARAVAQGTPTAAQRAEARRLFEQGVAMTDSNRWAEALALFERSRAIVERPNTVFNIAQALLELRRPIEAERAFEEYLQRSDPRRDAEQRGEATRMLGSARAMIATLELMTEPAVAEVTLDGQPVAATSGAGSGRTIRMDPGRHVLAVSSPGRTAETSTVDAEPGQRLTRTIQLAPEAAAPTPPRSPPLLPTSGQRPQRDDTAHAGGGGIFASPVFWIVTGVIVVGAGVGIGVAVASGGGEQDRYRGSIGVVLEGIRP